MILFADDARLVLTFIGDERQPGFDLLETMWFDYEEAKFELHAYLQAPKLTAWAREHGLTLTAYQPLCKGELRDIPSASASSF